MCPYDPQQTQRKCQDCTMSNQVRARLKPIIQPSIIIWQGDRIQCVTPKTGSGPITPESETLFPEYISNVGHNMYQDVGLGVKQLRVTLTLNDCGILGVIGLLPIGRTIVTPLFKS